MVTIIEGIDRVGKSTLANKIAEETGQKIIKYNDWLFMRNEEKDTNNEAEKSSMMLQIIKQFDLNCIIDRLYISDYVYGKMERNYEEKGAENCLDNLYALNALLSTMKNEVIFIIPNDIKEVEDCAAEHGRDLIRHNLLFMKAYEKCKLSNLNVKKIPCKINPENVDEIYEQFVKGVDK